MAIVSKAIATLNSGEQSPALLGRWDTAQFFKGAAKLRNCYSLVTGGIVRRPGLEYVDDIQKTEPPALAGRRAVFIPYLDGSVDPITGKANGALITISFGQIKIYNVPALTVAATIVDTTYDGLTDDLTWTQKAGGNDIILFHPNLRPRRLSIATGTWTLSTLALESIPQHSFEDTTGGSVVSHVERMKLINFADNDRFTIFIDGIETGYITRVGSGANIATNIKNAIEALPNITVGDVTVAAQFGQEAVYLITLAGTVDGRRFVFTPGQIDEQNASTLDNLISFTTDVKGKKKEEDVWSGTTGTGVEGDRGWPRCGAFFGNRLFMAGSPALGNAAWGSRINNAEDFIVLEDPTDDSPILHFTDTDQGATFNQVFVGRHLQFFASNTEFYEPHSDTDILTPSTFTLRAATSIGAMRGAPPIFVKGSTVYLQRDGRALRRFIFNEGEQNYESFDISIRGGHLLDVDAIDEFTGAASFTLATLPMRQLAYQKSRDPNSPDRIYIVNEAGNLICVCVNEEERVLAWHQWETQGSFSQVVVVGDDVFVGVWRDNDIDTPTNEPAHFIERFDSRLLVDSAAFDFDITPPVSVSTSMPHLKTGAGETNIIEAIVDGVSQGTQTFNDTDTIANFTTDALVDWQVGLPFPDVKGDGSQVWIRTLPAEMEELGRILAGDKKRVISVILRLLDTGSVEVNGHDVPLLEWIEAGDLSLHRQTNDFEISGLDSWNLFGQIDVTQSKSDHLHLLALKLQVEIEDKE